MTTSTPARRRARLAVGAAAGLVLAVGAPLAASAHVHVTPDATPAGASTRLDFSFSHGCDGSPTTALVVDIPAEVDAVQPVADGTWTIARELGADGIPTRVTFTAVRPIDDGVSASAGLVVAFPQSAADTTVAFPVLQQCAEGETAWSEVAAEGQDPHALDAPAPVVTVGAVAAGEEEHGSADGHGDAAADGSTGEHATATTAADTADPVARWLAGGALVAALAAVVLTLRRRRA